MSGYNTLIVWMIWGNSRGILSRCRGSVWGVKHTFAVVAALFCTDFNKPLSLTTRTQFLAMDKTVLQSFKYGYASIDLFEKEKFSSTCSFVQCLGKPNDDIIQLATQLNHLCFSKLVTLKGTCPFLKSHFKQY
ncbi:uncharacterized protein Gasu_25690 [Galdieria sulphuraria]|uniref:Uncharacterized protein n=1 Tax=Galdieria sulphuraria TaxID=130081 RepID=M2W3C2_GALSU|nr:uncharacterized protein Gasu_25690 [Galdieria sulphuraria]EME30196.1 hypothetical protein Gasu_25690 [Galdieria sulphuraria]|eukprot:XP_005706716.1 hypothetical protein Gasu_25690 [Galdieria sulphuraria]